METVLQLQKRFMTDDEVISVNDKYGESHDFRVRIWQGSSACPVVLATLPLGQDLDTAYMKPSAMSSKIANYVYAYMLGYPAIGIIYHEADPGPGEKCESVYFETFGRNSHRVELYDPTRSEMRWDRLEWIVGGKIER